MQDVSRFKVGDIIRKKNGRPFSSGKMEEVITHIMPYGKGRPDVAWVSNGWVCEEIELVIKKDDSKNPFLITKTVHKLDRDHVTKILPSDHLLTISGGSVSGIVKLGGVSVQVQVIDIPDIIQHLQNYYDAVQKEKETKP